MTRYKCELETCTCGEVDPVCLWAYDADGGTPIVLLDLKPRQWHVLETLKFLPGASGADLASCVDLWSGDLYPALSVLEHRGLISSKWEEVEAGPPRRRLYTITEAGSDALLNRYILRRDRKKSGWWLVAVGVCALFVFVYACGTI